MSASASPRNAGLAQRCSNSSTGATDTRPIIVHVIDQLGIGGMETVAINVIEQTRSRYRHQLICLRDYGALAARLQQSGVPVTALGKRPGKDLRAYLRLRRRLWRVRPDLVHTYNIGAIDVAFWARLAGVRRIVHAEHGRDAADPEGRSPRYRWLRRVLAPSISAFIAVSADLSRWLSTDVGIRHDKVRLIRNGIDTQRYCPAGDSASRADNEFVAAGGLLLGTVGRLDTVKAFDVLIDAFARLCAQLPTRELRLVIVGDGPERDALTDQIAILGMQDRIRLAGARDDVAQIMQVMDIYVCSSIAEGVALTILEAMASGLPVVATRVGGNPELVLPGETGELVPASDPGALAAALRILVEQPDRARARGQAGRLRVCQHFSIEAMTAGYCRLYDELLGVVTSPDSKQARL